MTTTPQHPYFPPADLEELIDQLPRLEPNQAPAPYPGAAEEDHDGQDDLDELGAPGDSANSPREAVALGYKWIREDTPLGVGYCLRAVRSLYGVPALYPDAETAWERAERRHWTSTIPWGVPVWWTNGGYGHVALSLGRGRCLTTDYVETGELGVARIHALTSWCSGRLAGWSNDINGVDVYEEAAEPKRRPPFGAADRLKFLRHALEVAIENEAPERRIDGLRKWVRGIESRLETKGKK